jgi:hypothetical protein
MIGLTYANDKLTDGAGAQLQRIYGIYAVARFLRVAYIHSPLKKIGYQGLEALENNASSIGYEEKYNRLINIASDIELPINPIVHDMDLADIDIIKNTQADES